MLRISLAALLLLIASGCVIDRPVSAGKSIDAPDTAAQRAMLIGAWHGKAAVAGGGTRTWVTRRNADGSYRIDFTNTGVPGLPPTWSEVGIWGVSGGVLFTATRGFVRPDGTVAPAPTDDPLLYDTYRILKLDQDRLEYESIGNGERFVAHRMATPVDE